jgi:hypothetical protein
MRPHHIALAAGLVAIGVLTVGGVRPGERPSPPRRDIQVVSLVRSGGFTAYSRTLAKLGPADATRLHALSRLVPAPLPRARRAVLCADCRITRLDLVIGGKHHSYTWDAAPPEALRRLVAALSG